MKFVAYVYLRNRCCSVILELFCIAGCHFCINLQIKIVIKMPKVWNDIGKIVYSIKKERKNGSMVEYWERSPANVRQPPANVRQSPKTIGERSPVTRERSPAAGERSSESYFLIQRWYLFSYFQFNYLWISMKVWFMILNR